MKPYHLLNNLWNWLPPQTWPEAFAATFTLLLIFMATAILFHCIKGIVP